MNHPRNGFWNETGATCCALDTAHVGIGSACFEIDCFGMHSQLRKTDAAIRHIESWGKPTPLSPEELQPEELKKDEALRRKIDDVVQFIAHCASSTALSYEDHQRMEYEAYLTGELLRDAAQWGDSSALRRDELQRLEYELYKITAFAHVIEQAMQPAGISNAGPTNFHAAMNPALASLSIPTWDESKHPRDDRGRFGHGSGGGSGRRIGEIGGKGNNANDNANDKKKSNTPPHSIQSGPGTLVAGPGAGGGEKESATSNEQFRLDFKWEKPLPLPSSDPKLKSLLTVPESSKKDDIYKTIIYCPSVEEENFKIVIAKLRTSHPDVAQKYVRDLALDQRLAVMAILGVEGGYRPSDLTLRMTLMGVPSDMQKRVADFDVRYKREPVKNAETYAPVYYQFMKQASVMDLPEAMRAETRELESKVTATIEKEGDRIRTAYGRWKKAEGRTEAKVEILQELLPVFTASIGANSMSIKEIYISGSSGVAAVLPSAPNTIELNTANTLFSNSTPDVFALIVGALPHEMQHGKKFKFLMANRQFGLDFEKATEKSLLYIPSVEAINYIGYIDPKENTFGYVAQPIELQSHLLHKAAREAILKQLSQP